MIPGMGGMIPGMPMAMPGMPGVAMPYSMPNMGMPHMAMPGYPMMAMPMMPGMAGMPQFMMPGAPIPTAAAGVKVPEVEPEKATTMFVGNVNTLDNDFVRELLEQCDRVVKWNREADETTKKFPTFGFVEFESAQGIWRALQFLNGVSVGGAELLVKGDEKVMAYLDYWKSLKCKAYSADKKITISGEMLEPLLLRDCEDCKAEIAKMINAKNIELGTTTTKKEDPVAEDAKARADRRAEEHKKREELMRFRSSHRERQRIERWTLEQRDLDREYSRRLAQWEREEDRKRRDWDREIGQKYVDKQKLIDRDLQPKSDSKEDSRMREERLRRRKREIEDDNKDREDEAREIRKKREREEREQEKLNAEDRRREEELRKEREAKMKVEEKEEPAPAAQAEPEKQPVGSFKVNYAPAKQPAEVNSAFAEDAANGAKKPKLENYTSAASAPEEKQKKLEDTKALIARIPTATEDIFAFDIQWSLMKSTNTIEKKLRPWVRKKVIEYLGAEEQGMIDYIINKVNACESSQDAKVSPHSLLQDLKEFLDDDAEGFVVKMWRMIIFEFLRVQNRA